MKNKILVANRENLTAKHKNQHDSYAFTKYEVTKRNEFDQCYIALYEIYPKKSNFPFHYHDFNTEAFYIISGCGLLETNEDEIVIKQGDIIVCPPKVGGAHKLTNTSEKENLVYIDFDTTNSPDVIHYPNSDKIGIVVHNESSTFFKNSSSVDYYNKE